MSCANYPEHALKALADAAHAEGGARPTLVWALDSNRAGQNPTLKHVKRARAEGWECRAAQIPGSGQQEWHEMAISSGIEALDRFARKLAPYLEGNLPSAQLQLNTSVLEGINIESRSSSGWPMDTATLRTSS